MSEAKIITCPAVHSGHVGAADGLQPRGASSVGSMDGQAVNVGQPDPRAAAQAAAPQGAPPVGPQGRAQIAVPDRSALIRLGTAKDLIKLAGEPKEDLRIGSLRLWRNSESYKDVLKKLEGYSKALDGLPQGAGTLKGQEALDDVSLQAKQLEDLMGQLEELASDLKSYINEADFLGHTRVGEMKKALDSVRIERRALKCAHMQLQMTQGAIDRGDNVVPPKLALGSLVDSFRIGRAELRLAQSQGLTMTQIVERYEAGLPLTGATRVGVFQDDNLRGKPKEMGSGAVNTVLRANYRVPNGPDATMVFKVEKPLDEKFPEAAKWSGFDPVRPNLSGRNVATSLLDAHLGLGVIPHTEFASHEGRLGSVQALAGGQAISVNKATVRLAPELASQLRADPELLASYLKEQGFDTGKLRGDELSVTRDESITRALDYRDPVLRRDLTRLQWLDALTGQVDRHAGNLFVEKRPDGTVARVRGIDNDFSFGAKLSSIHAMSSTGRPTDAIKFPGLPNIVDRTTFDALMKLDGPTLDRLLGGLLKPEEIDATKMRLVEIQKRLVDLFNEVDVHGRQQVAIISSLDGWTMPDASERLGLKAAGEALDALGQNLELRPLLDADGKLNKAGVQWFTKAAPTSKLREDASTTSYVAREAVIMLTGVSDRRILPLEHIHLAGAAYVDDRPIVRPHT